MLCACGCWSSSPPIPAPPLSETLVSCQLELDSTTPRELKGTLQVHNISTSRVYVFEDPTRPMPYYWLEPTGVLVVAWRPHRSTPRSQKSGRSHWSVPHTRVLEPGASARVPVTIRLPLQEYTRTGQDLWPYEEQPGETLTVVGQVGVFPFEIPRIREAIVDYESVLRQQVVCSAPSVVWEIGPAPSLDEFEPHPALKKAWIEHLDQVRQKED